MSPMGWKKFAELEKKSIITAGLLVAQAKCPLPESGEITRSTLLKRSISAGTEVCPTTSIQFLH